MQTGKARYENVIFVSRQTELDELVARFNTLDPPPAMVSFGG